MLSLASDVTNLHSNCSEVGIGETDIGAWWACGDKERNNCRLFLDRASTRALCLPGRCSAMKVHWNCADKKAKHHRRWADCLILLIWLLMAATVAVSTESTRTPDPNHHLPHTPAAKTTGVSSFTDI